MKPFLSVISYLNLTRLAEELRNKHLEKLMSNEAAFWKRRDAKSIFLHHVRAVLPRLRSSTGLHSGFIFNVFDNLPLGDIIKYFSDISYYIYAVVQLCMYSKPELDRQLTLVHYLTNSAFFPDF